VKPHQIYAAGYLSDPHGTHRVCLAAIIAPLGVCREKGLDEAVARLCCIGAWQEWAWMRSKWRAAEPR